MNTEPTERDADNLQGHLVMSSLLRFKWCYIPICKVTMSRTTPCVHSLPSLLCVHRAFDRRQGSGEHAVLIRVMFTQEQDTVYLGALVTNVHMLMHWFYGQTLCYCSISKVLHREVQQRQAAIETWTQRESFYGEWPNGKWDYAFNSLLEKGFTSFFC